jgi:hypothetical protein
MKVLEIKFGLGNNFEIDSKVYITNNLEVILKVDNMFWLDFDVLFSGMNDDDLKETLEVVYGIDENNYFAGTWRAFYVKNNGNNS